MLNVSDVDDPNECCSFTVALSIIFALLSVLNHIAELESGRNMRRERGGGGCDKNTYLDSHFLLV